MSELIKQGNGFVVQENGEMVAEITFMPLGEDALIIDHTYVSEALRGRRLQKHL